MTVCYIVLVVMETKYKMCDPLFIISSLKCGYGTALKKQYSMIKPLKKCSTICVKSMSGVSVSSLLLVKLSL